MVGRATELGVGGTATLMPDFIAFDGIDGCGKSTQLRLFAEFLRSRGVEPVCFRDPGTTRLGEAIREILLHREDIPLAMTAEMLLYMAARAQLVTEQIKPALEAGRTVLCDRFLLANVVYQGCGGGLDIDSLWRVGEVATGGLRPELTFIFDVDVDTALARVGGEQDRLEKRGRAFFERLRVGYLNQAARVGGRVEVIDASRSIDDVQSDLQRILAEYISRSQAGA